MRTLFFLLASLTTLSAHATGCKFEIWNGGGIGTNLGFNWNSVTDGRFGDVKYSLDTKFSGMNLEVRASVDDKAHYAELVVTEKADNGDYKRGLIQTQGFFSSPAKRGYITDILGSFSPDGIASITLICGPGYDRQGFAN